MKSKKLLIILAVLAVVLIIFLAIGKKQGWFGQEGVVKVAAEKMENRDITEIITANGKIQPETEVSLSPDVSGEIVDLVVKEGDEVVKGQYLLKIKPEEYVMIRNRTEAALNSSRARLKQAEAQLDLSKLEYDRNKQLFEQKAISEAEYEQSQISYRTATAEKEAAEFAVQSARASLSEAEENLMKTSVYAPMSGTISKLEVELGERVVGTELMSGTPLMRIADLSRMEVEVEVNENDIVRVSHMDTALIEVDAYPDSKFKGIVSEIPVSANTTGVTTDQVTNFNVKILLLSESYQDKITKRNPFPLRPGMSATADIQTNRKSGVPSIPIAAVTTRLKKELEKDKESEDEITEVSVSSSGEVNVSEMSGEDNSGEDEILVVVFTISEENKSVMKVVETGIQDNNYIEIISGLDPEDRVVIAPYTAISRQLKDDMSVEVVPEDQLFGEGNEAGD
ncbi:MAG: efflux RND transporter periplasmic adaptor subunit [Bacteroidales bacterium]|nr:efflux RND transporter periplasmic adaptor subunit [Bacteroidales bacterium]MBN2698373.1 efflux RND transporter periplasmic adaptor subunit [Bacteroidales bacterium]